MGNSRKISNYSERLALFNRAHMMSMADLVAIDVETPSIDSGCSIEK